MSIRKNMHSKFVTEDLTDFLKHSQFLNDSPKYKNLTKNQHDDSVEKEITNSDTIPIVVTKKKKSKSVESYGESRQKLLNVLNQQLEVRKQANKKLSKSLSDVITSFEADYNILKENEQILQQLTGTFLKCVHQSNTAYKQKLKEFKEIHVILQKKYEETHTEQQDEMDKLGSELEDDIYKLKQKLISETKRQEWEHLQKYFIQAMHNNNF